jgi:hypothetical protein
MVAGRQSQWDGAGKRQCRDRGRREGFGLRARSGPEWWDQLELCVMQAPGLGLVAENWSRCRVDELEKGLASAADVRVKVLELEGRR